MGACHLANGAILLPMGTSLHTTSQGRVWIVAYPWVSRRLPTAGPILCLGVALC